MNDERENNFEEFDAPEPPLDLCNKILERVETTKQRERHVFMVKAVAIGLFAGSLSFVAIIYLNTIPDKGGLDDRDSVASAMDTPNMPASSSISHSATSNSSIFFVKESR